jgi:hypothetical protein
MACRMGEGNEWERVPPAACARCHYPPSRRKEAPAVELSEVARIGPNGFPDCGGAFPGRRSASCGKVYTVDRVNGRPPSPSASTSSSDKGSGLAVPSHPTHRVAKSSFFFCAVAYLRTLRVRTFLGRGNKAEHLHSRSPPAHGASGFLVRRYFCVEIPERVLDAPAGHEHSP